MIRMNKNFFPAFALIAIICFSSAAFALESCTKELNYTYKEGKYYGITDNSFTPDTENVISYTNSVFNAGPAGGPFITNYCGMNVGDSITINAVDRSCNGTVCKNEKVPLLKITMAKYNKDKLGYALGDDDTWIFNFTSLNPEGKAIYKEVPLEFYEYSSSAEEQQKTAMVFLRDGKEIFLVSIHLDSDAAWDGQLDLLSIKAVPDVQTVIAILAKTAVPAAPSTNVLESISRLNKKMLSDLGLD